MPPRARRTSPGTGPRRQPCPCFPHACAFSPTGRVRQPFQQSGAPGYWLFLTEQAARPVIHAGIKIREPLDAAGAATAGVRRGLEAAELGTAAESVCDPACGAEASVDAHEEQPRAVDTEDGGAE